MSERLRCLSSLPPTAVHWRSAFTGLLLESASSLARSSLVLLLFICLFIYDCQAAFFRVCVCVKLCRDLVELLRLRRSGF